MSVCIVQKVFVMAERKGYQLQKQVLLCYSKRKHPMKFSHYQSILEEQKALLCEAKYVFEVGDYEGEIILQIKSEAWGGKFIDLQTDEPVPDRSILRMVTKVCSVSR